MRSLLGRGRRRTQVVLVLFALLQPIRAAAGGPTCVGECDGSGTVAINEITISIRIVATILPLALCMPIDGNDDGHATIEEVVAAVRNALKSCQESYGGNPSETDASINVGVATALPGDVVQVAVHLATAGTEIAGTQNDLDFPLGRELTIAAREHGEPDCSVNPAINKDFTTFAFLPQGCLPATTCTGVRAVVVAANNLAPIPDGALYTCAFRVALEATPGSMLSLGNSHLRASDPVGSVLAIGGSSGTIEISAPTPTSTPLPTSTSTLAASTATATATATEIETPTSVTATPTATPLGRVVIEIGAPIGGPGTELVMEVRLLTSGRAVAATANDIGFNNELFEIDPASCRINPALGKSIVASALDATTVRVFVQGTPSAEPIPDGLLYACTLRIRPATQPGTYALTNSGARAFDPLGAELTMVTQADGEVIVSLVPLPSPTATSSLTPTSTRTAEPTATQTPIPPCPGDCNSNGSVTVNELIRAVNIALGQVGLDDCRAADRNGSGMVEIGDLVAAVNAALGGCPGG